MCGFVEIIKLMCLWWQWCMPHSGIRPVARGVGGGGWGGSYDPPPVAHPKDFVPPFSNFVPPFSNFVPPFSNFVPPFSNFVPPFSNFVPPLEYVDDVTRAMSNVQEWGRFSNVQGGGGACECPRVGAFFKSMTSRGQCPRGGGCAWCSTHPSSDPPPTWLAGYGPGHRYIITYMVDLLRLVFLPAWIFTRSCSKTQPTHPMQERKYRDLYYTKDMCYTCECCVENLNYDWVYMRMGAHGGVCMGAIWWGRGGGDMSSHFFNQGGHTIFYPPPTFCGWCLIVPQFELQTESTTWLFIFLFLGGCS